MFAKVSKAGIGMYITVAISIIQSVFGISLDYNTVLNGVLTTLQAIGFIVWIVGQFARKDLSFGIFRRE